MEMGRERRREGERKEGGEEEGGKKGEGLPPGSCTLSDEENLFHRDPLSGKEGWRIGIYRDTNELKSQICDLAGPRACQAGHQRMF